MTISSSYGETHPGKKRRRNEDAFVCDPPLFAVADGMGGAQAGEVASSLAATALSRASLSHGAANAADAEQIVRGLVSGANTLVHQRATHDASASGMGTTMTVALAGDGVVAIGHVGDSRAYLMRDGVLDQITDDHSLVAELVRRGELSPAEAETHPHRSVITRALGTDADVEADVFSVATRPGDVFLICSDGLSTMVDVDTIAQIVARNHGDLGAAARELIRAANDAGGEDNITAVLFEIGGDATLEPPPAAPPEEDTLHPEDRVPTVELPAEPPAETQTELREGDTFVLTYDAVLAATEAAAPPARRPPVLRMIVATLVIVALGAVIVFLALWGLAR